MFSKKALALFRGNTGGPSLVPSLAFDFTQGSIASTIGGVSPSFTRVSAKTIIDWEGSIRNILGSEAPFEGLRRVRNILSGSTEDFSNAAWIKSNVTVTPNISDPIGGTSASTITATSGGATIHQARSATGTGATYRNSIWIRRRTGTGTVQLRSPDNSTVITITAAIADGQWRRYSGAVTIASGGTTAYLVVVVNTFGDEVDIWHPLLEDVTGQANQNPSEYVSVGVLSTPFHGAAVDGVKYFTTLNGNTVASNIVTEATGEALGLNGGASGQVGVIKGYYPEAVGGNLCHQSENFGTTWVAVGTPTRVAASDRCGNVILDLIGDDDAAALEGYTQTIGFTGNAVKAISVLVKGGTSASSVIRLRDTTAGADCLLVTLAWAAGVPTPTAVTGTVLGVDTLCSGVYRIRMATTAVTAANTNSLQIYPATDAALSVAAIGNILAGGVQAENAITCTSYIPTTAGTASRNGDVLTVSSLAGWFNASAGTMVWSIYWPYESSGGNQKYVFDINDNTANERIGVFINSPATAQWWSLVTDGGVAQVNEGTPNSWNPATPSAHKGAQAYALNDFAIVLDGGTVEGDNSGTLPTVDRLHLGHARSTSQACCGIRTLGYYAQRLQDAQLQSLTA